MIKKELSLEEKKKVSFDILKSVCSFCEEHGIRYYLAYGTLLGAIRHKGFIPWDDDVDLLMPRPDYIKFLDTFEGPQDLKVVSCFNSRDYVLPFAKVQNNKTKMMLPSGKIIDQGLGIDLFPVDGIPDDLSLEEAERIFRKENDIFIKSIQKYDNFKFLVPKTIKEHIKVCAYKASILTGILNGKCRKISKNPFDSDYDSCSMVASAVGMHSGKFRPFKKEWFDPIKVEFEGDHFIAPAGYDEILSMIYSNYMELPPEKDRITTHIAKYIWS